ncbi:hypothetical protein B0T14DRAFT_499766 [Immersiella caudata]|uniref:C2H2-type domain-containing protein n=1 Tax=Immersiella caudata TaxID=314043 RepID=A0AA39WFM1_9PEZI|nr:hypothetical protein B0T14DRAFT_499766 [Immersiella caudata]
MAQLEDDKKPDLSPGPIGCHVRTALLNFGVLVDAIKNGQEGQKPFEHDQFLPQLQNEVTRFKMWAGNLGAHQAGRTSLDYRLREASHLQEQVVYLLRDISESLQDAIKIAQPPSGKDIDDSTAQTVEDGASDDASEDSFTDSDSDEEPSAESRLPTLCTDIREAIDCLLRLSVAIANPAPHERFRKFGAEDISYREPHDVAYVRDKFPKLNQDMVSVLGKSITRRRQFFRYRLAHHEKLAAGLESNPAKDGEDNRTEAFPKTVASTLPDHIKSMASIDLKKDFIDEDNRSDTAASMTSYATSAGFLVEVKDGETVIPPPPLRVPPPPPEAEHGAFECAFCYRMISASTRPAWKRHVFSDLRPYTCLFKDCIDYSADFERRSQWRAHILQHHWKSWFCPFQCHGSFTSPVDLKEHLTHQHLPGVSSGHLETIATLGERSASETTAVNCPICNHVTIGLRQYTRHIGRHLEQLALFALPKLDQHNAISDDEDGTDSAASIDEADNDHIDHQEARLQLNPLSPARPLHTVNRPTAGDAVLVGEGRIPNTALQTGLEALSFDTDDEYHLTALESSDSSGEGSVTNQGDELISQLPRAKSWAEVARRPAKYPTPKEPSKVDRSLQQYPIEPLSLLSTLRPLTSSGEDPPTYSTLAITPTATTSPRVTHPSAAASYSDALQNDKDQPYDLRLPDASASASASPENPKRYPCPYRESHNCPKTFTTSGHAARHAKIHEGKKSVPCSYPGCTKKFKRVDGMKQHLNIHYQGKLDPSTPIPVPLRDQRSNWFDEPVAR